MVRGHGSSGPARDQRRFGRGWGGNTLIGAVGVLACALPALAQTQPDVVVTELSGSNMAGINFVWAGVLIGIAAIILVAQQIIHRLALRRESDAEALCRAN